MHEKAVPAPMEPARILDWWRATHDGAPANPALVDNGVPWSFAQVDARSVALARGLLAQGAGKGSRIGLLFPNRADWVAGWLAISRIGGIAVTLSTFFAPPELVYAIHHADLSWLLCAREYLGHAYDERLATALPGLARSNGQQPLALAAAPYLRGIWFDQPVSAGWAAGTLDDLAASADACPRATTAMLAAVEDAVVPADLGLIMYTSGSTAAPKGVVHTQAAVARKIAYMAQLNSIIPFDNRPGDRPLITSPLFWVGGFLNAMGGMMLGGTLLFEDDHSPANLLRAIREHGATSVSGGEGFLRSIRELEGVRDDDLARLRPQHSAQLSFFRRFFGYESPRVLNSIGMTETLGPHSGDHFMLLPPDIAATSCGFPLGGVEYRMLDPETGSPVAVGEPGELCLRAPWLMDGFYKRERRECFDADGFYHTGDICRLLPDGRIDFVTRHGGMIKTSGANVSPPEVEQVLFTHPEIVEAAVFGLPDRERGERVVAVVALRAGSSLGESAVKQWAKERLSAFKVPRKVIIMPAADIPRTPSQKVRKPALIEMVRDQVS